MDFGWACCVKAPCHVAIQRDAGLYSLLIWYLLPALKGGKKKRIVILKIIRIFLYWGNNRGLKQL